MPVNFVHSLLHRVEKGWDPISPAFATEYDKLVSAAVDPNFMDRLSTLCGGLAGKSVLDLGGGPGHYSVLFAKLGARVTWHDPSRQYQKIARARADANDVSLEYSLGYLEDAKKFGKNAFDLVFCRVCWYYSRGDRAFARLLYRLLKPGGLGYIECNTSPAERQNMIRNLQAWLNSHLWLKVGHPFPPRGRIANLFHQYPVTFIEADYRYQHRDIVIFTKTQGV
jgi:2-polyprenyl-3-methyl-5-hydroxy-6-metoxy-1,4-benzoquinol methylase